MTRMPESVHRRNYMILAVGCAAIAILAGLTIMVGWWLHIVAFTSIVPGLVTMKPNTAFCFILAGIALLLFRAPDRNPTSFSNAEKWIARSCAAALMIIGAITFAERVFGWKAGIDELLFRQTLLATHVPRPGLMAAASGLAFFILGATLLLLDWETAHERRRPAQGLALLVILIGFVSLLGYVYGVRLLYGASGYSAVAVHAAIIFILLGLGALFARPDHGLMAVLTSDRLGGLMARRLMPFLICSPVLIGWLRRMGEHAGIYRPAFGSALFTTGYVIILASVAWVCALWMNHVDLARSRVEERDIELAAIVDSSSDAIVGTTLDGTITSWNKGAERLYGYGTAEVLGKNINILTPEGNQDLALRLADARKGFPLERFVTSRQRMDKHLIHVSLTISRVCDRAGRLVGASDVARDITEQLQAEERLSQSQARLISALEGGGMGTWVWDIAKHNIILDDALAVLFGHTSDELPNGSIEPFITWVHPHDRDRVRAEIEDVLLAGTNFDSEYRLFRSDRSQVWIAARGRLERDAQGRPFRMTGICIDITDRKKMEEQLLQSQKMEALGTLAGGIAHDFNNILLAIGGNASLAIEELPPDHPAQASLREIAKAGGRASALVRQILAFSRRQTPTRNRTTVQPVVEEVLALLRSTLPARIEISLNFVPDTPAILADSTQLHQVIMNLCTNAARAIGEQNGTLEISVRPFQVTPDFAGDPTLRPGQYVKISISDTGTGMDSATVERIFDPFFTTQPPGQGTGLGLSVVHGIMKDHDGSISVYSEPGKGSVFHLYFPAAVAPVTQPVKIAATMPRGHGEHLLYVDDEEALVTLASRSLSRLGYKVTCDANPMHALQIFAADPGQFSAVITDLSMPGMSGADLARRVLEIRPDIPLVMTSGYLRPEDETEARQIGVRELILKPDTIEELAKALHRVFVNAATPVTPDPRPNRASSQLQDAFPDTVLPPGTPE